jgi:hypothetical protein
MMSWGMDVFMIMEGLGTLVRRSFGGGRLNPISSRKDRGLTVACSITLLTW